MSVYMTEEEQLAVIKKWWQRYGSLLTVIVSLILLTISGYKYWQWHQNKVITQASNAYEHMMIAFSNNDSKSVKSYANQLINEYNKTVYADAARMTLAKLYTVRDHYGKAREMLEEVVSHSQVKALKQVARIRIARLLASEKAYTEALTELDNIDDLAYMPMINELKGDIFAATNQYQQALTAYKQAISEVHTQGMGNMYLEMKTNELAAFSQPEKKG